MNKYFLRKTKFCIFFIKPDTCCFKENLLCPTTFEKSKVVTKTLYVDLNTKPLSHYGKVCESAANQKQTHYVD